MINNNLLLFGGTGLAGTAIKNVFKDNFNVVNPSRNECDLNDLSQVMSIMQDVKPKLVINCAGLVGGILFNQINSCESLLQNMSIGLNVTTACLNTDVVDYIYLGSNCIYPNNISGIIKESDLLSSKLEPTNRSYALAKISTIQYIKAINDKYNKFYFAVMPPNLYGDNDTFHPLKSHVLQSLIIKIDNAKKNGINEIEIWGDGTPRREFLNSLDLADGILYIYKNKQKLNDLLKNSEFPIINIGTGIDIKISDLAIMVSNIINHKVNFKFDHSKPNGTFKKLLDTTIIKSLGWNHKIELNDGINQLYKVIF
jgi:GDP-L-fucose synthase